MDQGSSLLLGIEGLQVLDVRSGADGRRVAQCVTDPELAGWCPQCGEQSSSPKGWVTTRPRDVMIGPDVPILLWRKQKWRCKVVWCERKSFTESLPGIPARSRLTARLRLRAAEAIGEHTRSVSDVAGEYGMTWPIAHRAFIAYADQLVPADGPPPTVTVLGIDETRRGKGRYQIQTDTGVKVWIDRFDTGLVARQRLRRPVRADQRAAPKRHRMDRGSGRRLAGRNHPRRDRHVGHLRQGRSGCAAARHRHPGPLPLGRVGQPCRDRLPARTGLDQPRPPRPQDRPRVGPTQPAAAGRRDAHPGRAGQDVPGDEGRRPHRQAAQVLAGKGTAPSPAEAGRHRTGLGLVWQRLTDFQMFCADHIDIRQICRLAQTVDHWRSAIIEGIFTGISNGRSEGYNRIVKHIGRIAFGFRNPANQKRRIRFACTRASRRAATTLRPC